MNGGVVCAGVRGRRGLYMGRHTRMHVRMDVVWGGVGVGVMMGGVLGGGCVVWSVRGGVILLAIARTALQHTTQKNTSDSQPL